MHAGISSARDDGAVWVPAVALWTLNMSPWLDPLFLSAWKFTTSIVCCSLPYTDIIRSQQRQCHKLICGVRLPAATDKSLEFHQRKTLDAIHEAYGFKKKKNHQWAQMDKKASKQRIAAHIFPLSLNCYLYIWNIASCSGVLHTRACLKGALLSDTLPADWRGHYHNDAALEEAVKDKSAAAALTLNFEHQHIISPGNRDSQSARASVCSRLWTPPSSPRETANNPAPAP